MGTDLTVEKVKKRISETALVVVTNIDNCLIFGKELWKRLPAASLKRRVLNHFQSEVKNSGESET